MAQGGKADILTVSGTQKSGLFILCFLYENAGRGRSLQDTWRNERLCMGIEMERSR